MSVKTNSGPYSNRVLLQYDNVLIGPNHSYLELLRTSRLVIHQIIKNLYQVGLFNDAALVEENRRILLNDCPSIVVGTPESILAHLQAGILNLGHIKHIVIDECELDRRGEFFGCTINFNTHLFDVEISL